MVDSANTAKLLTASEITTSLTGAVTAVFFVTQGVRSVFGINPRFFGYSMSLLLALLGVWVASDHSLAAWITALPNSFIIYAAAVGFAGITARPGRAKVRAVPGNQHIEEIVAQRGFWRGWY